MREYPSAPLADTLLREEEVGMLLLSGTVRRFVTWTVPLWCVSCGVDSLTTDSTSGSEAASVAKAAAPKSSWMAALRALQQAPGYQFACAGESHHARMGVADRVEIMRERVAIAPLQGPSFGFRATRIGRHSSFIHALGPVLGRRAEGQEVVLVRSGLEESYLTGPRGLEQSFLVTERPAGAGSLVIEVEFEGLQPVAAASGMVELRDQDGNRRAVYRDLAATDARGRALPTMMRVGEWRVALEIVDEEATYPVEVDPLVVTEQAKLVAPGGVSNDAFGYSVSLAGDTALVGSNNIYGVARVWARSGSAWAQQATLTANGTPKADYFGRSLSVFGDTALIGAPWDGSGVFSGNGAAYVFVRNGSAWALQAKLTASDGVGGDFFGGSVSLSGDTALVGASDSGFNKGSAYVFVRTGTVWTQQAKLIASDGASFDHLGSSVALTGNTALVGAPTDDIGTNTDQGSVYVFVRSGTTWTQQTKLITLDGAKDDQFGTVSVSGDTALIGASGDDIGTNTDQGSAYVFVRSGTTWAQQAKLIASDGASFDWFGSVSLSADTALIGAPGGDIGTSKDQGSTYAFVRGGTKWTQQAKLLSSDGAAGDLFGASVSASGDTALIGAWGDDIGATVNQGSAYALLLKGSVGDPCAADANCASGFCADGVCCSTACTAGSCDACAVSAGAVSDGTCALLTGGPCDDGDLCTQTDVCQAGTCTGSNPVVCAALDSCHDLGVCNPATGCSNPAKADGSACDDGNACTQSDACQSGSCKGSGPVTCAALDDCHDVGSCEPSTGACSNPPKADGSVCSGGICQSGTCSAGVDGGIGGVGGTAGVSGSGASGGGGVSGSGASSSGANGGKLGTGGAGAARGAGESGGCGCRAGGEGGRAGGLSAALILASLIVARRLRSASSYLITRRARQSARRST